MQTLLLGFVSFWIIAASIARYYENKKILAGMQPALDAQKKDSDTISKYLGDIQKKVTESHKFLADMFSEEPPPPVSATRIYAAFLRNGLRFRLHMLPAESVEEFYKKSQAIVGPDWRADVVEYLDVVPKNVVPTRGEKKSMGIQQGLYFLQMAKDKFSQSETQRKALESVITNYKKTYELS